jgi:hypothetical protein
MGKKLYEVRHKNKRIITYLTFDEAMSLIIRHGASDNHRVEVVPLYKEDNEFTNYPLGA